MFDERPGECLLLALNAIEAGLGSGMVAVLKVMGRRLKGNG